MRKTVLFLSLLLSISAYGNHYADTYVIPIAGHIQGANGSMWRTDVVIRNFRSSALEVDFIVIESGLDTSNNVQPLTSDTVNGTVTIPANDTVLIEDIMKGHGASTGMTGALIVGADFPFAISSRTYNDTVALGQTVPATRDFFANSFGDADNAAFAYIPGIVNNGVARTNVGFTAGAGGSAAPMTVEILIRNDTGAEVGSQQITIPAGRFMHIQVPVGPMLQAGSSLDLGSVDFRIVAGEGVVVPYASVIHNASSVATFMLGQFPDPILSTSSRLFRSLVR
jgi:hypothetical protein